MITYTSPRVVVAGTMAAATVGALLLGGCGESVEDSRKSLDSLVTDAGYDVLDYGQNQYGGMHYDMVSVGTKCMAAVWTATNDAHFDYFDGQAPIETQVFTNDDFSKGGKPFKIYESADEDFLSLEQLIAEPIISRICIPQLTE